MANLPVLDQSTGSANEAGGLCYSYVASQMVDAYLQKHGNRPAGRISSPFQLAMNQAVAREKLGLRGGEPCVAIKASIDQGGTCDHDKWFIGSRDPRNSHYLYTLEDIWNSFQWHNDFQEYALPEYQGTNYEREAAGYSCRLARYDLFGQPDQAIFEEGKRVLGRLLRDRKYWDTASTDEAGRAKDKMLFMRDFANMMCKPADNPIRPPIKPMANATVDCKMTNYGKNDKETLKLDLLKKLNTTGLPISVGFCSFYLQDSRRAPSSVNHSVMSWEADSAGANTPKCEKPTAGPNGTINYVKTTNYHISMVVGRRWQNNRCQVLLRNTWGADACESYRAAGHSDCSGGQVWLDLDELAGNSFAIRAIE